MAKIIVLGSHAESLILFRKEMLQTLACNNTVIACVPDANANLVAALNNIGVKYQNVALARTGLNPIADFVTLVTLYKLFKHLQPDIVFSYTSKPVIFGSIAAKMAGVRRIYSMITGLGSYFIYNDFRSCLVRTIMLPLYKIALHFNTKVFFQNQDDCAEFARRNIFGDLVRTVMINGSGVNIDYFNAMPVPAGPISFILIARLIRDKGIYEYLAAAKIIKQQYPQAQFTLVGWFDNKRAALNLDLLQPYIADNIITFLGKLDDVRPALANASVFVLPSYREGTPKSVLEAMATGRAIITTDVPGCRETVQEGVNGFLVEARDSLALAVAMERFIVQPKLIVSMGNSSRAIAVAKFNVHLVNQTILNAMEQQYA